MVYIGYILLALIAGAAGGAVGGILVGGKDLGNDVAGMMGSLYGPVAAVPGVIIAMILFALS